MGMNFTAYLGHVIDLNGIQRLCDDLSTGAFAYDPAFKRSNPGRHTTWSIDPDGIGGTIELRGPGEFSLTFSEHVCYIFHLTRWGTFLANSEVRQQLRRLTADFAWYFRASFALYVPDNATDSSNVIDLIWEEENRTIGEMEIWLRTQCGEPAELTQLDQGDYSDTERWDVYFIDRFDTDAGR